jgi:XTP/dITP diphosphohydrolase
MPHVLVATHNAGKLREIRQMTAAAPISWHSLDEFPHVPPAEETGATFTENARLKALYYARHCGLVTLADDSGLEVDALDGAPGVQSARYAGTPRSDDANNRKLIQALADVPPERRAARFRCAMAVAEAGETVLESVGTLEGRIIDTPRGHNGFGYDPHFLIPDLNRTAAELPSDEKNARSHRGQALRGILPQLQAYFRARGEWTE